MDNIIKEVARDITYNKGLEYYVFKRVTDLKEISPNEFEAKIKGTETYDVYLNVSDLNASTCTCPFHAREKIICKHIVATFLAAFPESAKEDIDEFVDLIPKVTPKKPRRTRTKKEKRPVEEPKIIPVSEDLEITASYEGKTYTYRPTFVGEHIKKLRLEKKMSKSALADLWCEVITEKDVSLWEAGNNLPSIEDLKYLADVIFDVSLDYLLFGKEYEEKDTDEDLFKDDENDDLNYSSMQENATKCIKPGKKRIHRSHIIEPLDEDEDLEMDPDEEVIEYLNGEKDFSDLSDEAQMDFFENWDDD